MDNYDLRSVPPARRRVMLLPVKSRRYDDRFWKELMGAKGVGSVGTPAREDDLLRDLGF